MENNKSIITKNFPRSSRLLTAEEYRHVFQAATKICTRNIAFYYKFNKLNYPRLGLAIAKKNIPGAVARNRLKRIIRESFRLKRHEIGGIDVVAIVYNRPGILDKKELQECLEKQWKKLVTQRKQV